MALSYAPFESRPPISREAPRAPPPPPLIPENSECNYIAMLFVGAIILMGLVDATRKR